ncbi:MAG TPA: response regulator [Rhodocyclaceae bacterium]|nr:response regulator [Rhodocyclaceae bacterium]
MSLAGKGEGGRAKGGFAADVATATQLSWLWPAVDEALANAETTLTESPDDARAAIHQVSAALSFTRLQGAALFAATVERLLASKVDTGSKEGSLPPSCERDRVRGDGGSHLLHPSPRPSPTGGEGADIPISSPIQDGSPWNDDNGHGALVSTSIATLRAYLNRLLAGAPDQPLALYPAYRQLLLTLGLPSAEANAPSDLFFPDLSLRPPPRDSDAAPLPPEAQSARLKAARLAFDRGWQKWRHGGKDDQTRALRDMRNAAAIAEQQQATPDDRAFWWICVAFFDALADSPGEPGDPLRQELAPLLERIEAQVADLTEGSGNASERLLRDVLYEVAVADSSAPSVTLTRSAYRLAQLIPKEAVDGAVERERQQQRLALTAALEAAKADWNTFCAGSVAALLPFDESAQRIAEIAAFLGLSVMPGFIPLAAAVGDTATALRRNPLAAQDQLHEDVSIALLLLADGLDQATDNESAFAHEAEELVERLQRLLEGETLGPFHLPPPGHEAHGRLAGRVAIEAGANLYQAQRQLAPVLAGIEPPDALLAPLRQVKGALTVLGKHGAARITEELLASLSPPVAETLPQAAADLALLTLYAEQLPWSNPDILAMRRAVNRSIPVVAASAQAFPVDPEEEAAALQAELEQLSSLSLEPLPEELESSIDPQQLPVFLRTSRSTVAAIGDQLRRWHTAPSDNSYPEALTPLLAELKTAAREAGALGIVQLIQGLEDRLAGLEGADDADIDQLEDGFDRMVALLDMLRSDAPPTAAPAPLSEYETPLAIEPRQLDRLLDQVHEIAIGRRQVEAELRALNGDLSELGFASDRLRHSLRELENLCDVEEAQDAETQNANHIPLNVPAWSENVADVATLKQALEAGLERLSGILGGQARLQRDLSHGLLRLRLAPFSAVAPRLLALVEREAEQHGTPVSLAIEGEQTELDRTVLGRVAAVLDLLLRKAAAHPDAGPMALHVRRQADEAIVELTGLPADLPLDICGDHLATVGGRMESEAASGLLRISVPATPALGQALLVSAGGRRYGIPASLVELAGEASAEELASARRDGGITFADRQYPWHTLPQLLGLGETVASDNDCDGDRRWRLLLHSGARQIALEVDAVLGRQEVAMKSLGPQLSRVRGIAGATVLDDGEVLLLIDPVILAFRPGQVVQQTLPVALETVRDTASVATVLVVDDSPSARNAATRLLEKAGLRVVVARDGVEALEKVADVDPVLVVVDADMPRMGGLDLIHCLRSDPALADVPVILAAHGEVEIEPELGMVHCVGKPYDEGVLLRLVRGLIGAR